MNNTYLKLFVDCLEKYQKLNDTEFGRLIRAALHYKANGEEVKLTGREELLWDGFKLDIDRDNERYAVQAAVNAENGKKGGRPKKANESEKNRMGFLETEKSQDKEKEEDKDKEKEKEESGNSPASTPEKPLSHKHGEYGWVLLTDNEYNRLIEEFGDDKISYYITYVDESAQSTKNKNSWKDWNLVIRKAIRGKWGKYEEPQNPKPRRRDY